MNNIVKQNNHEKLIKDFEKILVRHTAFVNGLRALEQAYNNAPNIKDPIGYYICGESRSGKSRLAEEFYLAHPISRTETGIEVPVLCVTVPSKPTVKGLAAEILRKLNDPMPDKGTEQNMTARLKILLRGCKVRVLILDEAQHFVDKSSKYTLIHEVSDWLKILLSNTKVVTVIAGLEYARMILSQNEQLRGRFANSINLPRFSWEEPKSRAEFIGLVTGFSELLSEEFTIPNLGSNEMALRLYMASGGLTGYVFNILRKTVWNVIQDGKTEITLEDLDLGYKEMLSIEDQHQISPFARNFDSKDVHAFQRASMVGRRANEYMSNRLTQKYLQ